MRTRRIPALAPIILSNSRKDSPLLGASVFSAASRTLYTFCISGISGFLLLVIYNINYIIAGGCVWTSFSFSLPVDRTYPYSRRQVCRKAGAAAHCCPFRYGESLCNCYLNRLSHFQVSEPQCALYFQGIGFSYGVTIWHCLIQDWKCKYCKRPQCLVFVVCCIAYYISSQGHLLRIQIYCATDRALRSRLRISLCVKTERTSKISKNYWRIHL